VTWWHRKAPGPHQWMDGCAATGEWDTVGWRSSSGGASATTSKVVRAVMWGLLFSGPFLGGAALLSQAIPPAGAAAPVTPQHTVTGEADQVGPAGWADLYVDAYVAAGQGSEQQLAVYYPAAAQLTLSGTPGAQHAVASAPVRVQRISAGYWSVTVGVQVASSQVNSPSVLRYFQVPVHAAGSGFVATALPAAVAAPAIAGASPQLAYGQASPASSSDPATATLSEFLSAYLTGNGDLTRDLSPGTVISPVTPAPYTGVSVSQVSQIGGSDNGDAAASSAVPADGTRRQVLADVEATDSSGVQHPLTYAIELKARAGRWEVDQLQSAPLLASGQQAATSSNGAAQ
jgi:hypothetical protein